MPTEAMRTRVCPNAECGHQNQPNAKHCSRCGKGLGDSPSGAVAEPMDDLSAYNELSANKKTFFTVVLICLALGFVFLAMAVSGG